VTIESATSPQAPAYGRFTRRVQAVFVDAIVLMLAMTGALIVATSLKSDNIVRVLGFTIAITWLLYEPLLVSMIGSTVGHYIYNLRVVDDRGGNPSFRKALLRVGIKSLLGLYSFLAMAVTKRHQAVHDLLTGSTVQIRTPAKAEAHHFHLIREEPVSPDMPSPTRRAVLIVAYVLGWLILVLVASAALYASDLISDRCLDTDFCSLMEDVLVYGLSLCWPVGTALLLFFGWRGRLWGARPRR